MWSASSHRQSTHSRRLRAAWKLKLQASVKAPRANFESSDGKKCPMNRCQVQSAKVRHESTLNVLNLSFRDSDGKVYTQKALSAICKKFNVQIYSPVAACKR